MKKLYRDLSFSVLVASMASQSFAGLAIGDPESEHGEVSVSGALRANYQDAHYGEQAADEKIKFNAAILDLGYESPKIFGKLQYRCYQYDTLCDFSTLVQAYGGYRINPEDNIIIGLQPVPFGPGRYWDSSFYASINNTMGLQDVLNLGVNYHFETNTATKFDLAYFAKDGGAYNGDSKDSARYTSNVISSYNSDSTDLSEKNMFVARVEQDINLWGSKDLNFSIGAGYWYSEIENKKTDKDGTRKVWNLFNKINYKDLNITLTGGKLDISNKDNNSPNSSTFGSFDSEYNIANEGYYYTVDARYTFKNVQEQINVTPYAVFSGYAKNEHNYSNSQRNIVGIAWDYKNVSLYTEYVMGKNDPFIGGSSSSLVEGDDGKWNKLLNIMLVYNF